MKIFGICFGKSAVICKNEKKSRRETLLEADDEQDGADGVDVCAKKTNKYDSTKSSTYKYDGKAFSIGYGDGSAVSGTYGVDVVNFAGVTVNTHVAQAVKLNSGFEYDASNGILGLSFSDLNSKQYNGDGTPSLVTGDMVAQGVLEQNMFAVSITETGGEIHLGGMDKTKFTGPMNYVPVTQKAFWQFNIDSITVKGNKIFPTDDKMPKAESTGVAISDTGTSLIVMPFPIYYEFINTLGLKDYDRDQGLFKADCEGKYAPLDFVINGVTYSIEYKHYKIDMRESSNNKLGCYIGVAGQDVLYEGDPSYILGDSFLRAYYAVYDIDNARVGFAPHA